MEGAVQARDPRDPRDPHVALRQHREAMAVASAGRSGGRSRSPSTERADPEEERDDEEEEDEEEDSDEEQPSPQQQPQRRNDAVHLGVSCDGCGSGPPLFGMVMKCLDCQDFDFCAQCYRSRRHRHPSSHRFAMRTSVADRRGIASILANLMEEEMLREAMRQSMAGSVANEEPGEDPEVRAAEALSSLPRVRWAPDLSTSSCAQGQDACEECSLCLEEYKNGEEVLRPSCGHFFHEACLGPWLTKSLLCPVCRQTMP